MAMRTFTLTDIDRYELAAIFAGLRLLQATPALPLEIEEIATDCGDFEPLDGAQIDDLCERINTVSEYPWRDLTGDMADADIATDAGEERAGEAYDVQIRDRATFAEGM